MSFFSKGFIKCFCEQSEVNFLCFAMGNLLIQYFATIFVFVVNFLVDDTLKISQKAFGDQAMTQRMYTSGR